MDLCHCEDPVPEPVEGSRLPACKRCGMWHDPEAWRRSTRVQHAMRQRAETEDLVDHIMRGGLHA